MGFRTYTKEDTIEVFGYIGAIVMGISLGLLGGGGSILSVPILVYLFKVPPVMATAYSLFVVGLSALVGGFNFLKKKQVDLKTGVLFATPAFVGVFVVRKFLMPALPKELFSLGQFIVTRDNLIMLVFAAVMLMASIAMIRTKPKKETAKANISPTKKYLLIGAEGLLVGGVTGFVGAGGGFLIVPALVLLTGLEMKVAVGTSLFIIAAKSLIGFIGDVMNSGGQIEWMFLFTFFGISVVGIFVGSMLNTRMDAGKLKKGFGWFVLVMGIFILYKQLSA